MRLLLLATLSLWAAPLAGQVQPRPGTGDPRIQTVEYDREQVVQLQGAPGYQLTVEFGPDEQIENVAVGDSAAWQATPNRRGDPFRQADPGGRLHQYDGVTSVRVYLFELVPLFGPSAEMAFTVRFSHPVERAAQSAQADRAGGGEDAIA